LPHSETTGTMPAPTRPDLAYWFEHAPATELKRAIDEIASVAIAGSSIGELERESLGRVLEDLHAAADDADAEAKSAAFTRAMNEIRNVLGPSRFDRFTGVVDAGVTAKILSLPTRVPAS
jgi:hypothetical protein